MSNCYTILADPGNKSSVVGGKLGEKKVSFQKVTKVKVCVRAAAGLDHRQSLKPLLNDCHQLHCGHVGHLAEEVGLEGHINHDLLFPVCQARCC